MPYENTLVIIKPDGVRRGLAMCIQDIFKENHFSIHAVKTVHPTRQMIADHLSYDPDYAHSIGTKLQGLYLKNHLDQNDGFLKGMAIDEIGRTFQSLIADYLTEGDNIALVLSGENAIGRVKELCGATFPADADKNSIRGMFGTDTFEICMQEKRSPYNVLHAADSKREADHQIALWFPEIDMRKLNQNASTRNGLYL